VSYVQLCGLELRNGESKFGMVGGGALRIDRGVAVLITAASAPSTPRFPTQSVLLLRSVSQPENRVRHIVCLEEKPGQTVVDEI